MTENYGKSHKKTIATYRTWLLRFGYWIHNASSNLILEPTLKQIVSSKLLILVTGEISLYHSLPGESEGFQLQNKSSVPREEYK
jgi:hypothetical protein